MTIYLDTVFLVNALLDGGLLLATSRVTGRPFSIPRLLLSAICGGLYATATLLIPVLGHLGLQLPMAACLVFLAGGTHPGFMKETFCFLAISAAFAGFVFAICQIFSTGLTLVGSNVYYPISLAGLLITAAAAYLLSRISMNAIALHTSNELKPVTIGKLHFTALVDTGNTLRDPTTNRPILVVYWKIIASLLPMPITQATVADPVTLFTRLSPLEYRLIPYRAIGVSHGFLLVKRCPITIGSQYFEHGLVAFSPTPLSESGTYDALTGRL